MTDPRPDDSTWRNRFLIINFARIGFTILVLLGILIWQTDWLRAGGAPEIGLPLTFLSLAASFIVPQMLTRRWSSGK